MEGVGNNDQVTVSKPRMDDLVSRIRGEYNAISETVHFGELSLDFWHPADPDALLDDEVLAQSTEELEWQPYWVEAWDAAYGVARELAERNLQGTKVLDLGCGLGLTGAVAAAKGARVVMADNAPPALLFAEVNSWPWRDQVQTIRLDWHEDRLDVSFDLIVGSDILYDRDDLPSLDIFWQQHLKTDGSVLLGDPTRTMTKEFINWICERGWDMKESTRHIPQSDRPIRLLELRHNQTR